LGEQFDSKKLTCIGVCIYFHLYAVFEALECNLWYINKKVNKSALLKYIYTLPPSNAARLPMTQKLFMLGMGVGNSIYLLA
jgi:hypothetical protein